MECLAFYRRMTKRLRQEWRPKRAIQSLRHLKRIKNHEDNSAEESDLYSETGKTKKKLPRIQIEKKKARTEILTAIQSVGEGKP